MHELTPELTAPVAGFRWAAVRAGIKKNGNPDLAVVVAEKPCVAAAFFTSNRVKAAPVLLGAKRVKSGKLQAVLVNAGCANACTGAPGLRAAGLATAALAAELGVNEKLVLPSSTGVIGVLLPHEKITASVPQLVEALSSRSIEAFARAIMTTDRWPKVARRITRQGFTVLGIAKGAGMIHPNFATTLAYVVTDAPLGTTFARQVLKRCATATFECISVDGDTSTNDTIALLASGAKPGKKLLGDDAASRAFERALREVLHDLSESIVADGEGAEHVVRIEVTGAKSEKDAKRAALRVATSSLVKAAIHGKDPNWGRILSSLGTSGAAFNEARVRLWFDDVLVVNKGLVVAGDWEPAAHAVMTKPKFTIRADLGAGRGKAHYLTCDLGHEYVRINADYRS